MTDERPTTPRASRGLEGLPEILLTAVQRGVIRADGAVAFLDQIADWLPVHDRLLQERTLVALADAGVLLDRDSPPILRKLVSRDAEGRISEVTEITSLPRL